MVYKMLNKINIIFVLLVLLVSGCIENNEIIETNNSEINNYNRN